MADRATAPTPARNTPNTRPWWRGFAVRVMAAMTLLAMAVIAVTAAVSYEALRERSIEVTTQALEGQASTLRHDLETRITHLSNSLNELSSNSLFANALADDLGREVYLRDFMRGFTSVEDFAITLVMTDFTGRRIASNDTNEGLHVTPEWISKQIFAQSNAGLVVMHEQAPYLVLMEPIIYRNTGTAEGALIYQVNLAEWLKTPLVETVFAETDWLLSLDLVDAIEHDQHAKQTAADKNITPEAMSRIAMPEGVVGDVEMAIHLTAKPEFVTAPVDELLINVAVFSLLIFLAALMASWVLSRTLTRKLRRLKNEAALVPEAKFRDIEFTDDDEDEIDDLARAFTTLFDELQRAYRQLEDDSRREIEIRERHYQGIVNNSAEGIITISSDGLIETFNPSAESIFGYRANEVIGKNVSMLMPTDERTHHDQYLKMSHLHAPRIINRSRELEGLRKSGETFPLELNISPMTMGDQKRYIGIMRDISERKQFEERINAARVEAEEANQAKSQFLSSMSHELRTPLNAILGFGQLLDLGEKTPLSDSQKEAVQQILKGGHHLLELIDQVLNLAKIESGSLTLSLESVPLAKLVDDTLTMAKTMAEQRDVTIHVRHLEEPPDVHVQADRTRLQQVLLNLLSNAVKYNVQGGEVHIAYETDPRADTCRVSVRDTGQGIPEHLHGSVFAPFNRLGAERSGVEGTGIGLTITRELVDMMHGEIGFTSTPGDGTTFWFTLPLSEPLHVEREDGGEVPRAFVPKNDLTRTVLYIEDNPSNLELMAMLLANRPDLDLLKAHTAETGLETIHRDGGIDLVLMDVNLPGMSGIDALRALRADPATRDIPVIAISANAMPKEVDEALGEGFEDYLTKPLDLNAALAAIDKALSATADA